MILPVADLEIVARGELPENLVRAALVLADHGFSGLLFQSGTEGRGRHSFLADFLLPEEDYVGLMAIFMKILTPPECQMTDLVELWCQTLQTTISSDQVIAVATHMLKEIPPDTETGSWIDLRWVAHLLEDVGSRENIKGVSVLKRPRLRSLPAKSYPRSPQCLGEISYWRGQDDEVIFASGWPC
jgi:hypothetical protein